MAFALLNVRPVATTFRDLWGKSGTFYLRQNPWKPKSSGKIFRSCIVCGDERFPQIAWDSFSKIKFCVDKQLTCSKYACYETLPLASGVIPSKHLSVKTVDDEQRVSQKPNEEFVESIGDVTINPRPDDRVHMDIPEEYRATFDRLENISIDWRIGALISVEIQYIRNHNISADGLSDPFLRILSQYRAKCQGILRNIEQFEKPPRNRL